MDKKFIKEVRILVNTAKSGGQVNVNYIATIYNKIFGSNKKPSFCVKCIQRDIEQIESWLIIKENKCSKCKSEKCICKKDNLKFEKKHSRSYIKKNKDG